VHTVCNHCGCRAFEPVAQLSDEHDQILHLSAEIGRAVARGDCTVAAEQLRALHDLLEIHDAVEELSLYPAMARNPEFLEKVGTLFDEHDDFDRVVGSALTSVQRTGPSSADWAAVLGALEMLAEHIDHEEHGVFPAAAVSLDPADWEHAAAVRVQQTLLHGEPVHDGPVHDGPDKEAAEHVQPR
jgi:hemerythrin-like domain-containing protein